MEELKRNMKLSRNELKADCQIVSIAVVNGASCIYTYDEGLKAFAEGTLKALDMPAYGKPLELPF